MKDNDMAEKTNMLQTIKDLDGKISSYTDEVSSESRELVINSTNGREGIIVSYNVSDPEGKGKGNGHLVKWKGIGDITWHSKKSLENVNSDIKMKPKTLVDVIVGMYAY